MVIRGIKAQQDIFFFFVLICVIALRCYKSSTYSAAVVCLSILNIKKRIV